MKIVGLDISNTTGWSLLDDGSLSDYGTIQLNTGMDLPQRLHYFHLELLRTLEKIQPDWCFIEDVILGISGAKTLAYLGRLNGVAINAAFSILQERTKLYEPTFWKANSLPGLSGMAKKWEIQLAVVKHFNIPITGSFDKIDHLLEEQNKRVQNIKETIVSDRTLVNQLKSSLVRKRKPLSEEEKKNITIKIKGNEKTIANRKKLLKKCQTEFEKLMTKTSIDISAQTGMTTDICDATGVAICGMKELCHL